MKSPPIFNSLPFGDERTDNALRLAYAPQKGRSEAEIATFLTADTVLAAKANQKTPGDFHNIERALRRAPVAGGKVAADAGHARKRAGFRLATRAESAKRSTMDELAQEATASDRTLVL